MASGNPTQAQSINPFENFSPSPAGGASPPAAPASAGWGAALGGAWAPAPAAPPPAVHATEISPRPTYTLESNEPQASWSQPQGLPPPQPQGAWGTAPPTASAPSTTALLPPHAQTSTSPEAAAAASAAAAGGQAKSSGWFKGFGSSPPAQPPPAAQAGGPPDAGDTRPLLVSDTNPSGTPPVRPEEDASKYAFYNLRRYRPYFNVETKEVLWRVLSSFIGVFKADFVEKTLEQPDLYGPFWIATTLIFVTAAAGNLASYIQFSTADPPPPPPPNSTAAPTSDSSSDTVAQWYADPTKLGSSAGIFYGYVFILSILLWLWVKYMRGDIKLVNVFCMYGYSMTIFIPVAMLCVIPITILQWVLIMLATAVSGGFLVRNLRSATESVAIIKTMWLLGVVLALHVGLGLALKLYFFKY